MTLSTLCSCRHTRLEDSIYLYRPTTQFKKRGLKFRAAKYYNELPEEIKFELEHSDRYNKSFLKNYLTLNSEPYHIYIKPNYSTINLLEIKTY